MVDLVYHTAESCDGGLSLFDEAIRDLTADADVLLASPYINLDYLESILADAASWRVLTDMEAWLGSERSGTRHRIGEFATQHHEKIHDARDLHAKAIITDEGALVGSANFTRKGLAGRDELAVSLNESESVDELRDWFDELWSNSSPATLDELDEFISTSQSTSRDVTYRSTLSISSDAPRVNSSLAKESNNRDSIEIPEDIDVQEKLVERVMEASSREWIDHHFDLLEEVLATTGLLSDDPRLVTSIPKAGGIHVTINSRFILTIMRSDRTHTGFILSDDTEGLDELIARASNYERFENEKSAPHLLEFHDGLDRIADPAVKRGWSRAALNEVDRGERSSYRRYHEPAVYRAAVDHGYRRRILDEAF